MKKLYSCTCRVTELWEFRLRGSWSLGLPYSVPSFGPGSLRPSQGSFLLHYQRPSHYKDSQDEVDGCKDVFWKQLHKKLFTTSWFSWFSFEWRQSKQFKTNHDELFSFLFKKYETISSSVAFCLLASEKNYFLNKYFIFVENNFRMPSADGFLKF